MNSKEKEELLFRMKKQLEILGEVPITNESFFTSIAKKSPLQT
jgi:hypothetical protein